MRFRVVRVYLVLLLEVLAHLAETGSFVEKIKFAGLFPHLWQFLAFCPGLLLGSPM
jgi:hypothetical protein